MNKHTRLVLMVAVSSLASQIYLNMFVDGFIIAMSPLMMAIFLYLFQDLDPVGACILVAVFSPLVRLVVMIGQSGNIGKSMSLVLPDMAFFLAYAFFFGVTFKRLRYAPYHYYYLRIALCDFSSNCVELTTRVAIGLAGYSFETFRGFAILAVSRSFFIILVCITSDTYKSLLERREHEEHYKRLVLMAATFSSEIYFMQKNMNEIEDLMKNSFSLYRTLKEQNYPKELQDTSLSIAKDIHEIKRGYRRVIKGLQDNFLTDFTDSRLYLSDLLKILSVDVERARETTRRSLSFSSSYGTNYLIQRHFAFTSILRNLIANSIDALETLPRNHHGEISILCSDIRKEHTDYCVIKVRDNGPGIPQNIRDVLYTPGFSTKYDKSTGDINRGLGLTLVKDLIEERFHGSIELTDSGKGALFVLWFPVDELIARTNSYEDEGYAPA